MPHKILPYWGGWEIRWDELFQEFKVGNDFYRTGMKPLSYPFYAYAPVVNGVCQFQNARFYVDKDGNLKATNADITGKIVTGSGSVIDGVYIKDASITSAKIADAAITTAKIQDAAITSAKIQDAAITTAKIGDLQVTNAKIASGLSANKITTGTLDASVVNVINLNASNITAGTLTGRTVRTSAGNTRVEMNATDNALYLFQEVSNVGKKRVALTADQLKFYNADGYERGYIKAEISDFIIENNYGGMLLLKAGVAPYGIAFYSGGNSIAVISTAGLTMQGTYGISLGEGATVDGVDISAHAANPSAHHSATSSGITIYPAGCHPYSPGAYDLGSLTYYWNKIWVRRIDGAGDTIVLHNHLRPNATDINLGNSTYYFNEIFAKYFTDVGCLGVFEEGVELRDGRIVSDLEALKSIKKHPTLKTTYGVPRFDYKTMPKAVYRAPNTKDGEDGADLTALISIMIGAIKELDKKVEELEKKIE